MKTCHIVLGRNGDIINALPLVLHDYQSGNFPTIIVSEPWAGLLDGIGYADKVIWHGDYSRPMDAKAWVESVRIFPKIYVPQCYGQKFDRKCGNFCEEAWRLVGMEHLWGTLPLIFDRRNRERESRLIPATSKPMVLVCSEGISHPFHRGDELMEALNPLRDTHEIVHLSTIKASRFFDLLGLFEKAQYLVTVDTGILHLARAVPNLPVISIIPGNDTTWDVAPRFKEHVARIYFDEFTKRKGEIAELIKADAKPEVRIIHVWSDYPKHEQGPLRRHTIARNTWRQVGSGKNWLELPLKDDHFKRSSRTDFGDVKTLPYIPDMIDVAARSAKPWEIILLTNDDTCLAPDIYQILQKVVPECGAIWCARREHAKVDAFLGKPELMRGRKHVGADVFAFTKSWWSNFGHEMPDMFVSLENWDYVLRTIIMNHGGVELEGLCYHEIHRGTWLKDREIPTAKHNQKMSSEFFGGRI